MTRHVSQERRKWHVGSHEGQREGNELFSFKERSGGRKCAYPKIKNYIAIQYNVEGQKNKRTSETAMDTDKLGRTNDR